MSAAPPVMMCLSVRARVIYLSCCLLYDRCLSLLKAPCWTT